MRCSPIGPSNARIVIVGEAPGAQEEQEGQPFVGTSGYELATQLKDAGIISGDKNELVKIMRTQVYLTNVCMDRPPKNLIKHWIGVPKPLQDGTEVNFRGKKVRPHVVKEVERLWAEIAAVNPNVIVAAGNIPLWALTDKWGISKWRGSQLYSEIAGKFRKIIPILHPAAVLRTYDWRYITVNDLKRIKRESFFPEHKVPDYQFITKPDYNTVIGTLGNLLANADIKTLDLVTDVEIKRKEILCVGIAWSKLEAICIPFYNDAGHYWSEREHVEIVSLIQQLFMHPKVRLCNQNISFDIQYFFWKFNFWPRAFFDTMISQGVLFSGLPKRLDFIASMVNDYYIYWKDDRKEGEKNKDDKFWDDNTKVNYPKLWRYNCVDCVATYEIAEKHIKALQQLNLIEQFNFIMHNVFPRLMRMMLRGVAVGVENKKKLTLELCELIVGIDKEITYLVGWPINVGSPKQMMDLFYNRLKLPVQKKKGQRNGETVMVPTCDDEALKILGRKEPLVRPLANLINMLRSYGVIYDAVTKKVDKDNRWRTSYNAVGTNTYRLSSSENPFDSGLNLQNLTGGKDIL